jgi:hypothetical protein
MRHRGEAETQASLTAPVLLAIKGRQTGILPHQRLTRQLILYEEGTVRGALDNGNGLISRSFWLYRSRARALNRVRP